MCKFLSFVVDEDEKIYYADKSERLKYMTTAWDSHSFIEARYNVNEFRSNSYEYNPWDGHLIADKIMIPIKPSRVQELVDGINMADVFPYMKYERIEGYKGALRVHVSVEEEQLILQWYALRKEHRHILRDIGNSGYDGFLPIWFRLYNSVLKTSYNAEYFRHCIHTDKWFDKVFITARALNYVHTGEHGIWRKLIDTYPPFYTKNYRETPFDEITGVVNKLWEAGLRVRVDGLVITVYNAERDRLGTYKHTTTGLERMHDNG